MYLIACFGYVINLYQFFWAMKLYAWNLIYSNLFTAVLIMSMYDVYFNWKRLIQYWLFESLVMVPKWSVVATSDRFGTTRDGLKYKIIIERNSHLIPKYHISHKWKAFHNHFQTMLVFGNLLVFDKMVCHF